MSKLRVNGKMEDAGYRFVQRGTDFSWRHPDQMREGDIDRTDMPDAELRELVRKTELIRAVGDLELMP